MAVEKWPRRIWAWFRDRNRTRSKSTEPLREFVYLDEVSVYSLLASKKRGIATQFTESQTAALSSELGSSLNIGFGGFGGKLDAKTKANQTQSSQVIRKATVQTSFKELFDLVGGSLYLSPPDPPHATILESTSDVAQHFERLEKDKLIVDPTKMSRGTLLEVKVELEADPLFRMATVITTLYELMADRPEIIGKVPTRQVEEVYSVGQVLDRLLTGLVPVRGRLIDFHAMRIGDRDILAHSYVKEGLGEKYAKEFTPVFVTGVAQQGLFWKDIRQILFSKSQYSVFCRLATEGLKVDWQPVKVVDLFEGIIPDFKDAMNSASEIARQVMKGEVDIETTGQNQDVHVGIALVREYIQGLEVFHGRRASQDLVENRVIPVVPTGNWHLSVTERRTVLNEVTRLVEEEFGMETPGETRLSLRSRVFNDTELAGVTSTTTFSRAMEPAKDGQPERFLDTEIVAMYW